MAYVRTNRIKKWRMHVSFAGALHRSQGSPKKEAKRKNTIVRGTLCLTDASLDASVVLSKQCMNGVLVVCCPRAARWTGACVPV